MAGHAAVPLICGAVFFEQAGVDGLAHDEAEQEEDDQEAGQAGEKGDDPANIDVLDLIAGILIVPVPARDGALAIGAQCIVTFAWISVHVPAPGLPPCADR